MESSLCDCYYKIADGPGPSSSRSIFEVERGERQKTIFSVGDVIHYVTLPTEDPLGGDR